MPLDGLTFSEPRHEYRLNGVLVPSVTQLTDQLVHFGVSEEILAAARERGTDVHHACILDDANDVYEDSITDEVAPYLAGYRKWKREMRPTILSNNERVCHRVFRFAGTLDLRATLPVDPLPWVVDLKTAAAYHPCMGLQTAGYKLGREHEHPDERHQRAILFLTKTGTYRWVPCADPHDVPMFIGLVNTFHWRAKHRI